MRTTTLSAAEGRAAPRAVAPEAGTSPFAVAYFETVGHRASGIHVHIAATWREALVDWEIEQGNAAFARLCEVRLSRDGRTVRRVVSEAGRVAALDELLD